MPSTLRLPTGEEMDAVTVDVSLGGLLLECTPDSLAVGEECFLTVRLSPEITISLTARIVRATKSTVAIEMVAIDDQSAVHLYNLISHNVLDNDVVVSEVRHWLGVAEAS